VPQDGDVVRLLRQRRLPLGDGLLELGPVPPLGPRRLGRRRRRFTGRRRRRRRGRLDVPLRGAPRTAGSEEEEGEEPRSWHAGHLTPAGAATGAPPPRAGSTTVPRPRVHRRGSCNSPSSLTPPRPPPAPRRARAVRSPNPRRTAPPSCRRPARTPPRRWPPSRPASRSATDGRTGTPEPATSPPPSPDPRP